MKRIIVWLAIFIIVSLAIPAQADWSSDIPDIMAILGEYVDDDGAFWEDAETSGANYHRCELYHTGDYLSNIEDQFFFKLARTGHFSIAGSYTGSSANNAYDVVERYYTYNGNKKASPINMHSEHEPSRPYHLYIHVMRYRKSPDFAITIAFSKELSFSSKVNIIARQNARIAAEEAAYAGEKKQTATKNKGSSADQKTAGKANTRETGDIPDILPFIGDQVQAGQFFVQKKKESDLPEYSGDMYKISVRKDRDPYIGFYFDNYQNHLIPIDDYINELKSGKYPFALVSADPGKTSSTGTRHETYRFRYTGNKNIAGLPDSGGKYQLEVFASRYGSEGRVCIGIRFSPGLTYAGQKAALAKKAAESGQTDSGTQGIVQPINQEKDKKQKVKCVHCDNGWVECSQCNGRGYFEKRVTVPNYSGKGTTTKTYREDCSKCKGRKKTQCTWCNGSGWIEK